MFTRFSKYLMVAVLAGIAASCTPGITDNSVCTDSTASNFQKPGQCEHNKPAIVSPSMGASIPATGTLTSVHFEATASVDWTLDGQAMITAKAFDRDIAVGPHTSCITGGTCSSFTVSAPTVRFTVHTQDGKPCGPMMARIEGKVPADSAIFVDTSDGCQVAWPSMFGNEDSVLVDIHGLSGKYFRLVWSSKSRHGATPLSQERTFIAGLANWNGTPIDFNWAYAKVPNVLDGGYDSFFPKGLVNGSAMYSNSGFANQPIKVALNHDGSTLPLDSAAIWTGLHALENQLGMTLFVPAKYSDLPVVNGVLQGFEFVRKDTATQAAGFAVPRWNVVNGVPLVIGGRILFTQNATSQLVAGVTAHEMMHMLGFGHDSTSGALMYPIGGTSTSMKPIEIVHAQWYYSMKELALKLNVQSAVADNVQGWRRSQRLPIESVVEQIQW